MSHWERTRHNHPSFFSSTNILTKWSWLKCTSWLNVSRARRAPQMVIASIIAWPFLTVNESEQNWNRFQWRKLKLYLHDSLDSNVGHCAHISRILTFTFFRSWVSSTFIIFLFGNFFFRAGGSSNISNQYVSGKKINL